MPAIDVVVVGAGVFGAWSAWHLRRAGASVRLIDAWGAGHSRSSSGDESRIIRMGYGSDEIYTRMAMRSLGLWQELFERTGDALFHRTGMLWVAREDDAYSTATRHTLERCGVPIEILDAVELAKRVPQMRVPGDRTYGIFEPSSGALMARRAVAAVVRDAVASGAEFAIESVTAPWDGVERAAAMVFACGPWLPKLFPELLGNRIHVTRQEVFYFAPPAGESRFHPSQFPVWIDFTDPRGPYGVPDLEGRGVKLAFDRHGPDFDPDTGSRLPSTELAGEACAFLAERFPDLRDAPLTETRVCQYESTSNGDFLIDRHPDFDNVWLVGGGSGHGFKHGPAVGEYVAQRITGAAPAEPRFSLSSKATEQRRTVY